MSFNKVIISGRLTADPEIKSSSAGLAIASFSIAVTDWIKNEEYTSFINCVAFGKTAERLQQYTKKGLLIGVEGSLRQSRWEDSQGNKKNRIEITVARLEIFEWKSSDKSNTPNNNEGNSYKENPQSSEGDFIEDETDIPF